MANTLITPTIIAKEGLMLLKNRLGVGSRVHRDYIRDMTSPKTGGTVRIRKPVRFTVGSGAVISPQDLTEYYTAIPAPSQKHVPFQVSSSELTLTIEQFSERYIAPAVAQLANQIDYDVLGNYAKVWNTVGTPGTAPNSFASISAVARRMDDLGVGPDGRVMALNPVAHWSIADALKGLFVSNTVEDAVRRGNVGRVGNFDMFMTQNVRTHLTGTFATASAGAMNGATAEGATTLVTNGWQASTLVLKAGDIFTIANVFEVNPMNRQSTGVLKQFVSQTDVTSSGAGAATITIYNTNDSGPGLRSTGAFQNCSAMPLTTALLHVWGDTVVGGGLGGAGTEATSYPQNLAFQRNAFALVFFNLETPESANGYTATDPDAGYAMRVIRDYDVINDREVYRLDVLYSTECIYPELAVRLVG